MATDDAGCARPAFDAPLRRILFGTDEEIPESIRLDAGALVLTLRGAKAWDIRCGDHEVWHGVAFLYRDAHWGTPEPVVDRTESTNSESGFVWQIEGHFPVEPPIDFTLRIEGDKERIRFDGVAVPRVDIQASRLGLCVMHPMSATGARVDIEHTDGRTSRSTFPTLIPPWPPFTLIRAIRHQYATGCWARCVFDGDAFELEDQRNNSDASFKTYSRSNLMPRPYWLRAGVAIRQSVELRLEVPHAQPPAVSPTPAIRVHVGEERGALPGVGIEVTLDDAQGPLGAGALGIALRELRPAHLHLVVDAGANDVDWRAIGQMLVAADAGLRLDINVDYRRLGSLDTLGRSVRDAGLAPKRIAVFPSEQLCLAAARRAFPDSSIGGGTPHFFVQLNRIERLGRTDFLTFTSSPVVHGADDESVMLTLQSLPSMIETLRATHPEARFAIGPSTIGARKSPLGEQPATDGLHRVALAQNDPRCRGLFGAAWVVGYVARLAFAGVDAITLLSLTGPSGVMADDGRGGVALTPAYQVLRRLTRAAQMRTVTVSEPSRVAALALGRADDLELLLANLTADSIDVAIEGWEPSSSAILDAESWATSRSTVDFRGGAGTPPPGATLRLGAYAVASLSG